MTTTKTATVAPGDWFRAESNGLDAVKWLRSAKGLVTRKARGTGRPVADVTIRRNVNEAVLAARTAGRLGNRLLDELDRVWAAALDNELAEGLDAATARAYVAAHAGAYADNAGIPAALFRAYARDRR